MALIKCPECGKDVSTSASTCPNCGYPIEEYASEKQFSAEVERLTKKIKRVEFTCPEPRAKVCIKCGEPYWYFKHSTHALHGKPSCDCHLGNHIFPGVEVDYPEQQAAGGRLSSSLYIFEQCVVPNNIGDIDSPEYINRRASLYSQIRSSEATRPGFKIRPEPPDEKYFGVFAINTPIHNFASEPPKNVPACPYCHSTDLTKISNTKKAAKIAVFGIFGAGDVGKTWKCNNCGSRF